MGGGVNLCEGSLVAFSVGIGFPARNFLISTWLSVPDRGFLFSGCLDGAVWGRLAKETDLIGLLIGPPCHRDP